MFRVGYCLAHGFGVKKNYAEAVIWYRKAAEQGHAQAQFNLAVCWANGTGVLKDDKQAVEWYRKAAEQGHAKAQHNLAFRLVTGQGTTKDEKQAVEWFRKAAEQGHAEAQYNLAVCLVTGQGTAKDATQAVEWYRKAAEQSCADAQINLANCSVTGQGIAKDEKRAVEWYCKAAEQGNAAAQHNLAVCLADGTGITKDEKQAVDWYRKAAEQGRAEASFALANCLERGVGIAKDVTQAIEWFAKAKRNGMPMAELRLMKLQQPAAKPSGPLSIDRGKASFVFNTNLRGPFTLLTTSTFSQAVRCRYEPVDGRPSFDVVVKVPKDPSISQEWLNEWLAMSALPPHSCVVGLVGLCENFECPGLDLNPPISFVSRFYANGSVEDFFAKPSNKGKAKDLLLPWALQIARGLAHLHRHKCVHRDLAARNVFVSEKMAAVVGDLGLLPQFDEKQGEYKSEKGGIEYPVPLEAAPESNKELKYSPASDMFSYGLTLFQIATECDANTDWLSSSINVSSAESMFEAEKAAAAKGHPQLVSALPSWVPEHIKDIMLRCLSFDAKDRPTADDVMSESERADEAVQMVSEGGEEESKEGFAMLLNMANKGNVTAVYEVGQCLMDGRGVDKNEHEGVAWYRKAAEQGYAAAQYNLAVCLENGTGTMKDEKQAVEWYRKAADQGLAIASS